MAAYSFDRFRREYRDVGKLPLPIRIAGWLCAKPLAWPPEHVQAVNEAADHVDAMAAALTSAERVNPRVITPSRRREVAAAAGLQERETDMILRSYDWFARSSAERTRLWWELMAIHGAMLFLLLLAAAALI